MPDVDTIIAEVKSKAEGRTRWEGQKPYADELLVAEIERLRADISRIKCPPNPSDHSMTEAEQGEFQSAMVDLLDCSTADAWMIGSLAEAWMLGREYAANRHEPHPAEPGVERGEGGE